MKVSVPPSSSDMAPNALTTDGVSPDGKSSGAMSASKVDKSQCESAVNDSELQERSAKPP